MFRSLAVSLLSAVCVSVSAQGTFQSSGLGAIDPWGVGTLSRADGALPNTLWSGSDPQTLETLFARTNPRTLSPVARELVARAVLSSARRPDGDSGNDLLLRRLKVIEDLGDIEIYSDFLRQMNGVEGTVSTFELNIDQQFARGNLASACNTARGTGQTSSYILNARAVCLALEGQLEQAELTLEFARAEGEQDIWFVETIGVMGLENPRQKPAPRFDSGLKLALSLGAELDIPEEGFSGLHPALATQLANRSDIPRRLRIQAADIAAMAGVMALDDYRAAYRTVPVPPSQTVRTIVGGEVVIEDENAAEIEVENTPVNALDEALQAANNRGITDEDKANIYRRALMLSRSDIDRHRLTAQMLAQPLRALRSPDSFALHGDVFALAAIVAEDQGLANRFTSFRASEGQERDEFLLAWIDGIQILNGRDRSPQSALAVSTRLAEAATGTKRARAAQMIHMIMTLGGPISPEGRALLAELPQELQNAGIIRSGRDLLANEASLAANALGEGALRSALLIGNDASTLNMFTLASIVRNLDENGFPDLARGLALEGIDYHRAE